MEIKQIVQTQRDYFATGATKNLTYRLRALARLEEAIRTHSYEIEAALTADLGKAPFESYMAEVGLVLDELGFIRRHLRRWATDAHVPTPIVHFPATSRITKDPYGVTLIMSPWNYPFLLTLSPLVGAVAAGNCAVVKPSAYSPATSSLVAKLCAECFTPGHVTVVEGGRAENTQLLEQRFDYIFFTGSPEVGKLVMEKASRNLIPVSLELGGKSPVIVTPDANIRLTGKRIAFGKWLNAGQTCIAPDYVLAHRCVYEELLAAITKATLSQLGAEPLTNPEWPKIVNRKHFERLTGLLKGQTATIGGTNDGSQRISPTVLRDVDPNSPVMQEEIFGPILPVIPYDTLDEAIAFINSREKPLALYLFTTDKAVERKVLSSCSFGGGCVNDTIVHIATSHMPFGGVGGSGMGSYHGKQSFDTFTHRRSILKKANWLDLPVRYHPYTEAKNKLLRMLLGR